MPLLKMCNFSSTSSYIGGVGRGGEGDFSLPLVDIQLLKMLKFSATYME